MVEWSQTHDVIMCAGRGLENLLHLVQLDYANFSQNAATKIGLDRPEEGINIQGDCSHALPKGYASCRLTGSIVWGGGTRGPHVWLAALATSRGR